MKTILSLDILAVLIFIIMTVIGIFNGYQTPDYIVLPIFFIDLFLLTVSFYLGFKTKGLTSVVKIINVLFIIFFAFIFAILYLYIFVLYLLILLVIVVIYFLIPKKK